MDVTSDADLRREMRATRFPGERQLLAQSGRSADNKLIGRNSFDYLLVESTGSWSRCHLQSLAWAGGRHRPLPITGVHKPATTRRAFARKWDELLSLPRPNSLQG